LFIPDGLFRKNQAYFNNLKRVSTIVGTSTYRATNKIYMRNRKVKAVSSFIGMLEAIALKYNNEPVKIIMLVDNRTQLFMQSLAAEINIHKTHRSTLQVKKNTLKPFYKESKNLLKRADL
jgi:S-methylmethionine-dependent homocysteine/selenocysteine methylase